MLYSVSIYFRGKARAPFALAAIGLLAASAVLIVQPATSAEPAKLTLYGAQHQQMLDMLVQGFKQKTGIEVAVHKGEAPEIANQFAQEGASSPADVYITENSPELMLLEEKGMLAKVDAATLAQVPAKYIVARPAPGPACWPAKTCSSTILP